MKDMPKIHYRWLGICISHLARKSSCASIVDTPIQEIKFFLFIQTRAFDSLLRNHCAKATLGVCWPKYIIFFLSYADYHAIAWFAPSELNSGKRPLRTSKFKGSKKLHQVISWFLDASCCHGNVQKVSQLNFLLPSISPAESDLGFRMFFFNRYSWQRTRYSGRRDRGLDFF